MPPKTDTAAISLVYETEPVEGAKQDSFYNIVARVVTGLTVQRLLNHLHNIEQKLHRRRLIHWGLRIIDLDIIDFGHQHIKTSVLIVPHLEMANRQFVLLPMREITNRNDSYYQQLDYLLNKTPDRSWLKKVYGREVLSWTNKK